MTKNKFIYFLLILVLIGLIFWLINLKANKDFKKKSKSKITAIQDEIKTDSVQTIQNLSDNLTYTFELFPYFEEKIHFNITGKLEDFSWIKGDQFKKGDLLFYLDNRELFQQIIDAKKLLKNDIIENLNEIEDEILKQQWYNFLNEIKEDNLLPSIPSFYANNYKRIQINNKVIYDLNLIQSLEKSVLNYFYIAPFDGEFTKISSESYQNVSPKTKIASICKNSHYILRAKIHIEDVKSFVERKYYFLNENDKPIHLNFKIQNQSMNDSVIVSVKLNRKIFNTPKIGDKIKVSTKKFEN